jgi:hypothetical protein
MPLSMLIRRGDRRRGPSIRQAVVALVVAASSAAADLANFSGAVDGVRLLLFALAGLLAAWVVLLSTTKKSPLGRLTEREFYAMSR